MGKSKPKQMPAIALSPGPSPRISRAGCGAPGPPATGPDSEARRSPRPRTLPVLAELISRGDGTYVLRPRVPAEDLDTWLTIQQAGEVIGCVNAKSVYRLLGEYLVYRKPLRRKILVSLKSALALKQATQDSEFWENPALQQRLKEQVRKVMDELTLKAMESLGWGEASPSPSAW